MRRVFLILAGVGLALILAELLLRLMGFGQISPQLQFDINTRTGLEQGSFVADRELFWRQADGSATELDRALKMVQLDDPVPARGARLRVIVLGDSCTRLFGDGLPYTALLELQLGQDRVEVHNASLPGYTSHQGLAWLQKQLLDFGPDLLVVYFGWNDHWRSTGLTDRQYAASLRPSSLRLLRLFGGRVQTPPLRVPPAEYGDNLRRIANAAAVAGTKTVFVLAPYHFTAENVARLRRNQFITTGDNVLQLHRQYLRTARSVAAETGNEVCDAAAIFAAVDRPQQLLHRDGIHLTDTGHAALAATLADQIVRGFQPGTEPSAGKAALDPLATVPALITVAGQEAAQGQWDAAAATYRRAIAVGPAELGPRLGLAWLLATCPVDSVRDGAAACAVLQPLTESEPTLIQYYDVAAAAAAEAGRYDQATAYAGQALELAAGSSQGDAADSPLMRDLRDRLSLYESHRPFRQPPPPVPTEN